MADEVPGLIYLASPYSHPSSAEMEKRFHQIVQIAGEMLNDGKIVYSPIVHNHPIAIQVGLPRGWEFWKQFDSAILSRCSELLVVMLPGWEDSKGIQAEIQLAEKLGLKIGYMNLDLHSRGWL